MVMLRMNELGLPSKFVLPKRRAEVKLSANHYSPIIYCQYS